MADPAATVTVAEDVLADSHSVWANRPALMELALEYGASVHAVRFQDVIEMWDRAVAEGSNPAARPPTHDAVVVDGGGCRPPRTLYSPVMIPTVRVGLEMKRAGNA